MLIRKQIEDMTDEEYSLFAKEVFGRIAAHALLASQQGAINQQAPYPYKPGRDDALILLTLSAIAMSEQDRQGNDNEYTTVLVTTMHDQPCFNRVVDEIIKIISTNMRPDLTEQ